jgi:hypothetical protein
MNQSCETYGHNFQPIFEKRVPSFNNKSLVDIDISCGDNGDCTTGDIVVHIPVTEVYLFSLCTKCGEKKQ